MNPTSIALSAASNASLAASMNSGSSFSGGYPEMGIGGILACLMFGFTFLITSIGF